jgi:hypothetical protein
MHLLVVLIALAVMALDVDMFIVCLIGAMLVSIIF